MPKKADKCQPQIAVDQKTIKNRQNWSKNDQPQIAAEEIAPRGGQPQFAVAHHKIYFLSRKLRLKSPEIELRHEPQIAVERPEAQKPNRNLRLRLPTLSWIASRNLRLIRTSAKFWSAICRWSLLKRRWWVSRNLRFTKRWSENPTANCGWPLIRFWKSTALSIRAKSSSLTPSRKRDSKMPSRKQALTRHWTPSKHNALGYRSVAIISKRA